MKSGKYYSKAVIWAKDNGVVTGVSDTEFDPDGKITR
ncbi:MAG: S-layer homology domain-containing protein, partial [Clostridia bacterium]|nr:S-layer homology domain-containing protein [Clostridia bacterium]